MNFSYNNKFLKVTNCCMSSIVFKCSLLIFVILAFRTLWLNPLPNGLYWLPSYHPSRSLTPTTIRIDKFLEVPQIIWGLNNQKIAFARACLTARLLNRTLLMPMLTANLVYKEVNLSEPIPFDKVFQFEKFNSVCKGFARLGRYSELLNQTKTFELLKGSGRKWTKERDLNQLKQCHEDPTDKFEVIRIVGKNPFLWHDHWPVNDYAKIFQCLALVEEIEEEATKVISKIRGGKQVPYIAVHMRIEKDWMIHCKKVEQRYNMSQICSSKEEIMERVEHIGSLQKPIPVYLAVADSLLEDNSILRGWAEGLVPYEKKRLGVWDLYKKHSYIIQAAMDFEVCLRADVFVGNSYSTFSSLVVLQRTQRWIKMGGVGSHCDLDTPFVSYAYNILGESAAPRRWMTDMSAMNLSSISYGTDSISC